MKGILGRKVGMTQVFTKDGKLIPVSVVEVEPNVVMQVKTVDNDGYNAIKLGVFEKKEKRTTKPEMGNCKKANTTPKRFLREIRNVEGEYKLGDKIDASIFTVGEVVDVTGTSKGKGFAGSVKRNNQSRGPMGHGSHYHRGPGSLGTLLPKRVLKGKRMPGHMGCETVTIQNLEIIDVNKEENYILISGNIPGAKDSLILIRSAVKKSRKENPKELITYESEKVVDEVVTDNKDTKEEPKTEEKKETVETESSTNQEEGKNETTAKEKNKDESTETKEEDKLEN